MHDVSVVNMYVGLLHDLRQLFMHECSMQCCYGCLLS